MLQSLWCDLGILCLFFSPSRPNLGVERVFRFQMWRVGMLVSSLLVIQLIQVQSGLLWKCHKLLFGFPHYIVPLLLFSSWDYWAYLSRINGGVEGTLCTVRGGNEPRVVHLSWIWHFDYSVCVFNLTVCWFIISIPRLNWTLQLRAFIGSLSYVNACIISISLGFIWH